MQSPVVEATMPAPKIEGATILTASGLYVEPLNLQAEDVRLSDIAHALSNQCRFSGHTRHFYSVAEHSVRVMDSLRADGASIDVLRWGLLHDASEAYLVDLPRPLKLDPTFGAFYREAETRAQDAIAEAFGLGWPEPLAVKVMDVRLLATERRDLMPPGGDWAVLDGVKPLHYRMTPWSADTARTMFLHSAEDLGLSSATGDRVPAVATGRHCACGHLERGHDDVSGTACGYCSCEAFRLSSVLPAGPASADPAEETDG